MRKQAIALGIFTVGYNLIEGIVAMFFGWSGSSVSLAGFGLDSFVEVGSAMVALFTLRTQLEPLNQTASPEQTKQKRSDSYPLKIIAWLLIALATITLAGSVFQLIEHAHPTTTFPGMVIAFISISFMWFLYRSKIRVGTALNSRVLLADAECSRSCMWLSVVLLLGSLLYWFSPTLWFVDSTAAIILSVFIAREGLETLQESRSDSEQGCCAH